MVKYCSTIRICHILFLRLSVDGHLFRFTLLAIGIAVQVFVGTYVFSIPGNIPRSRIAEPYDNSTFLRNWKTTSTILSFHKQSVRVLSLLLKKSYICIFLLILFYLSSFSFNFTKHISSLHLWLPYPTFDKIIF